MPSTKPIWTIFNCEEPFLCIPVHQPLLMCETEVKCAAVRSILTDVHGRPVAGICCLCDLGEARVLTEEEAEVSLDDSEDTAVAVTFRVEFVETVSGATEKQF